MDEELKQKLISKIDDLSIENKSLRLKMAQLEKEIAHKDHNMSIMKVNLQRVLAYLKSMVSDAESKNTTES